MKDKRRILTGEFASQMESQSEEHKPNRAGYCEDATWLDEVEVKAILQRRSTYGLNQRDWIAIFKRRLRPRLAIKRTMGVDHKY